jgi:hypothetical protein
MTNTDALTGKLLQVINQVQDTVSAHSGEAVNLVLQQVKINAIGDFIICFAAILVLYILWKVYSKVKDIKEENRRDMHGGVMIYICMAGLLSIFLLVLIFITLFNIWEYVAIINPKLYLAHEIIGKVLS